MGEKTKHFLSHKKKKKKATRREWESRNRASFRESGGVQEQPGECVGAEQHGGSLAPLCKDSGPRHGQLSHPKCSANCEHPLLPPSSQHGQLRGLGLRSLLPQHPASTWHQVRGEHTERAFPGLGSRRDFVIPCPIIRKRVEASPPSRFCIPIWFGWRWSVRTWTYTRSPQTQSSPLC